MPSTETAQEVSNAIGQKVTGASKEEDSALQKIKNEVDNFVKRFNLLLVVFKVQLMVQMSLLQEKATII